jgi:predicted PurR-regulated permease PerM/methylmalonyl-CoA mutase cobalamin-binding subunit
MTNQPEPEPRQTTEPSRFRSGTVLAVLAIVTALYAGRTFFLPLAISVLLAFLLAPVATRLECLRIGRVAAVIATVLVTFLLIGLGAWVVFGQIVDLAESLPQYKDNLKQKVSALVEPENGPLSRVLKTVDEIPEELSESGIPTKPAPAEPATPVRVVGNEMSAFDILKAVVSPVIEPLQMAAMILLLVIFMLISRYDLRDRIVHLMGTRNLHPTTEALDDAGARVSRYLGAQLTVNLLYGVPLAAGLSLIGIPNAILWGMLTVVLRFIPYLGAWLGAFFPICLSIIVSPGWTPLLATVALIVVLELVSNNVIEPWLYGASSGLSPMAVIVSAVFWTWLWGAGGLLIATPLTVCLVVAGRYIKGLSFLDVLLGDKPPIGADERFYQRMLAEDQNQLREVITQYNDSDDLVTLFDSVIIPALRKCEQDKPDGAVKAGENQRILELVEEALEILPGFERSVDAADPSVVVFPVRTRGDELGALMLAHLLRLQGVQSQVVSHRTLSAEAVDMMDGNAGPCVCLSTLSESSCKLAAGLLQRAAKQDARPILGIWTGNEADTAAYKAAGAYVVTSLRAAVTAIVNRAPLSTSPEEPATGRGK